jgi:hypothetical protein
MLPEQCATTTLIPPARRAWLSSSTRAIVCAATVVVLSFLTFFASAAGASTPSFGCLPSQSSSSVGVGPSTSFPSDQIVACVGSQPITKVAVLHWANIARRSSAGEAMKEAIKFLISSDWVLGEASDLGVRVSKAAVRETFNRIRAQQFPKRREFVAFMKRSGQTPADLLFRVRLSVLSERTERRVLATHHGVHNRQHALNEFFQDFRLKWMAQTYCEPQYAVESCGHVQTLS